MRLKNQNKIATVAGVSATLGLAAITGFAVMGGGVAGTDGEVHAETSIVALRAASIPTYVLSVNAGETIQLDATPDMAGVRTAAKDTVTVTTTAPEGYQLYMSTNGSDNKLNRNDGNNVSVGATNGSVASPAALKMNTWGFAMPKNTSTQTTAFDSSYSTPTPSESSKWAAVPNLANETLVKENSNPSPAGDAMDVYYGAYLNAAIPSGSYTNTVLYTAIANMTEDIAVMTPDAANAGDATTVSVATSLSVSSGNATQDLQMRFINQTVPGADYNCAHVRGDVDDNILMVYCDVPKDVLNTGTYNVEVTVPNYNKTYTIANGITISDTRSLADITTMQEMNKTVCANTPVYNGTTYHLTDTRDGNSYSIRKLKNSTTNANSGECWMVEGLRLTGPRDLTPDTTDIQSNWKLPTSTGVGATWPNDSEPRVITGNTGMNASNSADSASGAVWQQSWGNYYTWGAATANTARYATTAGAEARDSICPKGWHLPSNTGNQSYTSLGYAYGATATSKTGDATFPNVLKASPLSFPFSGYYRYTTGVMADLGAGGDWWSSTAASADNAYYLNFNSTNYYLQNSNNRGYGFTVRCVAE